MIKMRSIYPRVLRGKGQRTRGGISICIVICINIYDNMIVIVTLPSSAIINFSLFCENMSLM